MEAHWKIRPKLYIAGIMLKQRVLTTHTLIWSEVVHTQTALLSGTLTPCGSVMKTVLASFLQMENTLVTHL